MNSPGTVWGKLEVSPDQEQKKLRFIKKKKKHDTPQALDDTTMESKEELDTSHWVEREESKERKTEKEIEAERKEKDEASQFKLEIEHIKSGEDLRTTLMIRNIPNKYD